MELPVTYRGSSSKPEVASSGFSFLGAHPLYTKIGKKTNQVPGLGHIDPQSPTPTTDSAVRSACEPHRERAEDQVTI